MLLKPKRRAGGGPLVAIMSEYLQSTRMVHVRTHARHGKVHIVYHGTQRCIIDSLTQTESDITNEQQAAARVRAGRNRTVALQQMGKRLQGHMPHATEAKLQQTERLRHPSTHAATASVSAPQSAHENI